MSLPDPEHDGLHAGDQSDPALREVERQLRMSAALYAAERPGLADRVHAASAPRLAAPAPLTLPSIRRWSLAAAASVAAAVSVALLLVGRAPAPAVPGPGVVGVRSFELSPAGGSESLLVALIDEDSALHAADGTGIDAGALALMSGRSVDDVTIELDELLAAGGGR